MFAIRPINNSQVCVKEIFGSYEISIAFDDSCGVMKNLGRGDIRVYRVSDGEDVTEQETGMRGTIPASIQNLIDVREALKGA